MTTSIKEIKLNITNVQVKFKQNVLSATAEHVNALEKIKLELDTLAETLDVRSFDYAIEEFSKTTYPVGFEKAMNIGAFEDKNNEHVLRMINSLNVTSSEDAMAMVNRINNLSIDVECDNDPLYKDTGLRINGNTLYICVLNQNYRVAKLFDSIFTDILIIREITKEAFAA